MRDERLSGVVPILITAIAALVAYAGSYVALVTPQASRSDPLREPHVARYRVGGPWAETLFLPVHWVDRRVRSKYWTTPDCLREH